MNKPTFILWLVICGLLAKSSFAEQNANSKLHQLLMPIQTLSATFTQQSLDIRGEVIHKVAGKFKAMEPNKIDWLIEQPMPQQIISDGSKVWIYDPDLAQVVIQPYDNKSQNPISLLLDSSEDLSERIDISYINNQKSPIESFLLKPKYANALYTELQIDFIDQQPVGLRYSDNFGQTTAIDFHNLAINPSLSTADFIFEIPPDTDVVNHVR